MTATRLAAGSPAAGRGRTNAQVAATDRLVAPTKAIRVLGALRRGLDELERVDLDAEARRRVAAAHRAALIEAASAVSEALLDEMVALHIGPPSPVATLDQLGVGQAQRRRAGRGAAQQPQEAVDHGHQPWRLSPKDVASACATGSVGADVESPGTGTDRVTHPGTGDVFVVEVIQPVRDGPGGISAVTSVTSP